MLTLPSGGKWRMRLEGGTVTVEESIYLGRGAPRLSRQIVVAVAEPGIDPAPVAPAAAPDNAPGDSDTQVDPAPGVQAVRWALSSVD